MQNVQRVSKSKATTEVGFENRNRQVVIGNTGLPGANNQRIYELKCLVCGERYGANGFDIHERKCPNPKCEEGGGAPGLAIASQNSPTANQWTVANAKARLSEVLDKARDEGPQFITRNGKQTAVVVSVAEWERKTKRKGTLADFLMDSPLRGSGIEIERSREPSRDIEL